MNPEPSQDPMRRLPALREPSGERSAWEWARVEKPRDVGRDQPHRRPCRRLLLFPFSKSLSAFASLKSQHDVLQAQVRSVGFRRHGMVLTIMSSVVAALALVLVGTAHLPLWSVHALETLAETPSA